MIRRDRAPRVRPHVRRRAVAVFVGLVFVEVVIVIVVAAWVLLGARQDLQQARDDSAAGRVALSELDLAAAERSFASAADGFDRGASALRNPAVRLTRVLPVIQPNVAATEALAVSGARVLAPVGSQVIAAVARHLGDQPPGASGPE